MGEMEELGERSGKILLEMERLTYKAGQEDQEAVALVLGPGEVSLPVV